MLALYVGSMLQGGPKESTDAFVLYCCIAAGLVAMAGLMSGLTLGLLSLDHVAVEVWRLQAVPNLLLCLPDEQPSLSQAMS